MTLTPEQQRSLDKRAVFETVLAEGVAAVHFDPRCSGVQVPAWLRDRPMLVLNFSHRYRLDDFTFDDEMASASLSFAGRLHRCRVPWLAVFAITDDARESGGAWPEDLPNEAKTAVEALEAQSQTAEVVDPRPAEAAEGPLRLVTGGGESAASSPPARGHLRRIK